MVASRETTMSGKLHRALSALLAVMSVYMTFFIVIAALAQFQLVWAVKVETQLPATLVSIFSLAVVILFFAWLLLVASSVIPALVLHGFRIKAKAAYLANATASAVIAAYTFLYSLGVAFNIGAILKHVPNNGRNFADGWTYRVPLFSDTLANTFRLFPVELREEGAFTAATTLATLTVAVLCSRWFRDAVVLRKD